MELIDAYNELKALNLSEKFARLLAAQAAFETGNFKHPNFTQNNNPGGIMYINKGYQKDSVPGFPFPSNESKTAKYAKFGTRASGWRDMVRITYPYLTKATTPENYASILFAGGYYKGDQSIYAKNLRFFWNQLDAELKKKALI